MNKPIFGYCKEGKDSAITAFLYQEGTFIVGKRGPENSCRTVFHVSAACVHEIMRILAWYDKDLKKYAELINEQADFAKEDYYLFGDLKIVDWDTHRFAVEEERVKHPAYYKNAIKVELTEKYVRKIFNEICQEIEQDEKEIRHMQFFYNELNE